MSINSYAQNFEDVMLWRALSKVEHGFYIDIGAQDPLIDSVSRAFHEHGWRGIHVEPTPHYADMLREQRPGDRVIQAAVGNGPTLMQFFEIQNTGVSTAVPFIAKQHQERGFHVQEITVPCLTLAAIFDTCSDQEIHWLKIDVEGFEREVLSSWGPSPARPWIVIVESTLPLTQVETHQAWESILTDCGYEYAYFDGLNRYYVSEAHRDLKNAFLAPPNIFDGFTLNGTASATFHRLLDVRYTERIAEINSQNVREKQLAMNEIERLAVNLATLDKTHAEQSDRARHELEDLLRSQVQREKEVSQQMLVVQVQAHKEITEHARDHMEHVCALQRDQAEREVALSARIDAGQHAIRLLEKEHALREKELLTRSSETVDELENLLREKSQQEQKLLVEIASLHEDKVHSEQNTLLREHQLRDEANILTQQLTDLECNFSKQLMSMQAQAQQVASFQIQLQTERERAALFELTAVREGARAEVQALVLRNAEREREYSTLAAAQSEVQKALKHELVTVHQILSEKNLEVFTLASQLSTVRQSLSWKLTRPIRWLINAFRGVDQTTLVQQSSKENTNGATATSSPAVLNVPGAEWNGRLTHANEFTPHALNDVPNLTPNFHLSMFTSDLPKVHERYLTASEFLSLPSEFFVRVAYRLILGREADEAGLEHYKRHLSQGNGKISIVSELAQSGEAHSRACFDDLMKLESNDFISAVYQRILNREPDSEGAKAYSQAIDEHGDKYQIISEIENSTEAYEVNSQAVEFKQKLDAAILEQIQTKRFYEDHPGTANLQCQVNLLIERVDELSEEVFNNNVGAWSNAQRQLGGQILQVNGCEKSHYSVDSSNIQIPSETALDHREVKDVTQRSRVIYSCLKTAIQRRLKDN